MNYFRRLKTAWFGHKRPTESTGSHLPEGLTTPDPAVLCELLRIAGHSGEIDPDPAQLRSRLSAWRDQHPRSSQAGPLRLLDAALHRLAGETDQAHHICQELLGERDVAPANVHHELALIALSQHDLLATVDSLNVAVSLEPDFGIAWLRLGDALSRLDRNDEAEPALQEAIRFLTGSLQADAFLLLGEVQRVSRRLKEAGASYDACLKLDPHRRQALIARGHVHLMAEEEDLALRCYESAMTLSPQVSADVRMNIGSIRQNLGDYEAARLMFERLLSERPGDHAARWYLCQLDLLQGRWREGWDNYASRFRAGALPYRPMPYASWDGRDLPDDTLLVLADQGLGDEIMFASCLPDLQQRVPHAVVECEPRLLRLFERSFPTLRFIATQRENSTDWLKDVPTPTWQVSAGELPGFFRQRDADFPEHTGYLKADPTKVALWRERLRSRHGDRLLVGISWRGGLVGTRTRARSIRLEEWQPILTDKHVAFVNLQYGDYKADLSQLQELHGVSIDDDPEAIADYDETAALVMALDLVVSVCTSIIHLAGALGRPVWILTPHSPGWRYTADRQRMPWYPSSRIFRQPSAGDWPSACRELSIQLAGLTKCVNLQDARSSAAAS